VQRLPLSVRISGPQVNWRSHPNEPDYDRRGTTDANRWKHDSPALLERTTADGHRIRFWPECADLARPPRFIGWITLGLLLALTAVAYARVRRMLRPLDDIQRRRAALWRG
jgi:hypothetical protein